MELSAFSVITLLLAIVQESSQGRHEDRLINDIFESRHYQRLSRPAANEHEAVHVVFGLSLQQIIGVDEKNEFLHTNLWLTYSWKDYNLAWNASEYGNVQSIRLPASVIWTPDIVLYNSADEDIDSKFMTNVVVRSDGTCEWLPLGLFISSCKIDIRWFPFDEQRCDLKFGSWTYDGSMINLDSKNNTIDLSTYQPSGEWDLVAVPAQRHVLKYDCCPEPYIDITYTIHIRRLTLYYCFNLIIPCALISMLTLAAFLLPPDAGEKIGLTITILLSLSVFQLIVADMVPSTSLAVPLVGVYFASVMIMCTISVIMAVFVLNLHHRSPDMYVMPSWVQWFVCGWMAWVLRMSRPGHHVTRQLLKRRATIRRLEARCPPSTSLMANIRDDPPDRGLPSVICLTRDPSHCSSRGRQRTITDDVITSGMRSSGTPACRRCADQKADGGRTVPQPLPSPSRQHSGCGYSCNRAPVAVPELVAVLDELRYITGHLRQQATTEDETNEWKFAAMVIDRFCFYVFALYLVIVSIVIFTISPDS